MRSLLYLIKEMIMDSENDREPKKKNEWDPQTIVTLIFSLLAIIISIMTMSRF